MKLKTAKQWAEIYGIDILDDNGWRGKDDGVTLDTEIDVFTFINRANESTIDIVNKSRYQNFKLVSQVKTVC